MALPVEARKAPKGLSLQARRRWHEQVAALEAAGRLTPSRSELVSTWARSLDAHDEARQAWQDAGSPVEQPGRAGQPRPHHLHVSLQRAEVQVAQLTSKIERSARGVRRAGQAYRLSSFAVAMGSYVEILVDGRLLTRSVLSGAWIPTTDEEEAANGLLLRWLENDVPVFHDPPPSRVRSGLPKRAEALKWARARGIPEQAVIDWLANPGARSKIVYREDVDLATGEATRAVGV
jgi:hypothetical protein